MRKGWTGCRQQCRNHRSRAKALRLPNAYLFRKRLVLAAEAVYVKMTG